MSFFTHFVPHLASPHLASEGLIKAPLEAWIQVYKSRTQRLGGLSCFVLWEPFYLTANTQNHCGPSRQAWGEGCIAFWPLGTIMKARRGVLWGCTKQLLGPLALYPLPWHIVLSSHRCHCWWDEHFSHTAVDAIFRYSFVPDNRHLLFWCPYYNNLL